MKQKIKNSHFTRCMFFAGLLAVSMSSVAQRASVKADPSLGKIKLADQSGYVIDANHIEASRVISIKIPVINANHGQALPAGSCKIKIGLGSKLLLDPSFNLSSAASDKYFEWTSEMNGGQVQVTGELIAPLPASFKEVNVAFKVKGTVVGQSTITANFLISNHKTNAILSDENGTNNMAYLPYTVSDKPAPVTTTSIDVLSKDGCSLDVSFSADKEIDLARFEVEAGKDGVNYEKVSSITAANNLSYKTSIDLTAALQAQLVYVRIKTVERSGRVIYSDVKKINGYCANSTLKLTVYPNPVASVFSTIVINAKEGILDGKYNVKLMDMSGKSVLVKEMTLINAQNFKLDVSKVAAGKYLVQVNKNDGTQSAVLKFEKM